MGLYSTCLEICTFVIVTQKACLCILQSVDWSSWGHAHPQANFTRTHENMKLENLGTRILQVRVHQIHIGWHGPIINNLFLFAVCCFSMVKYLHLVLRWLGQNNAYTRSLEARVRASNKERVYGLVLRWTTWDFRNLKNFSKEYLKNLQAADRVLHCLSDNAMLQVFTLEHFNFYNQSKWYSEYYRT